MDTVVTTFEPIDLGNGGEPQAVITVADSKFTVGQAGDLIVMADNDASQHGSLALPQSVWKSAVRGDVIRDNTDRTLLVRRTR